MSIKSTMEAFAADLATITGQPFTIDSKKPRLPGGIVSYIHTETHTLHALAIRVAIYLITTAADEPRALDALEPMLTALLDAGVIDFPAGTTAEAQLLPLANNSTPVPAMRLEALIELQ